MANVRIRVGAYLDRGTLGAFEPIIQAAKRARQQVERELQQQTKTADRSQKDQTRTANRETQMRLRAEKQSLRDAEQAMRRAEHAKKQELKETTRLAMREARERERAEKQSIDAVTRHHADSNRRMANVARSVGRSIISAGRFAASVGMDLVRGAGVNTDVGSIAARNVSNEQRATNISNQAFMPGKSGAAGRRQDPKLIIDNARQVALATATSTDDALEGLERFVAKTGELDEGQKLLMDLAKLSKATGSNLSDMADAAGDVSNALGDVPNKSEAIADAMKVIAAQGKEGAVEIKDLSTQMAKVGAVASQFEGDKSKNLKVAGALTQFTRKYGGASSSTQAATSMMSFMSTFSKGARLDQFEKLGIQTKGQGGKIRDAEDIIFDALRATKGDDRAMGKLFATEGARRVSRGFESRFKENLANAKGNNEQERMNDAIKKTREEFDALKESTMSNAEINDSLTAAMNTQASAAQQLNTQLEAMVSQMQTAVLPVLVGFAPAVSAATDAIADLVTTTTGKDPRDAVRNARISEITSQVYDLDKKAKAGTLTETDLAKGGQAEQDLAMQAARDKATAADAAKPRSGWSRAGTGLLDWYTGGLGRTVSTAIHGGGVRTLNTMQDDEHDKAAYRKQRDADESARQLAELNGHMKDLKEFMKNGTQKTTIVGGANPNLPKQEPSL